MKNSKQTLLSVMSWVLAMMIAASGIFFLLNKLDVINIRLDGDTYDVINTVPLALVYLYGLVSAFYKTGSLKQTLIVGAVGVLVHLNSFLFIIPALGFFICGCMAVGGIIMYLYGVGHMEKWVPVSMMLMSCFCYEMAFFELGNGGGSGCSYWETFLLPVISILIIADLIATKKISKKDVKMKA